MALHTYGNSIEADNRDVCIRLGLINPRGHQIGVPTGSAHRIGQINRHPEKPVTLLGR